MATFFPAGISNESDLRSGRCGLYANCTFSKRMLPPCSCSGCASCLLYATHERAQCLMKQTWAYCDDVLLALQLKQGVHVEQALPQLAIDRAEEVQG